LALDEFARLIYFSPIPWNMPWQRHQELARRFAGDVGVFFIEPLGMYNAVSPGDLLARLKWRRGASLGIQNEVPPGVRILPLKIIPYHSPKAAHPVRRLNRRMLLGQLADAAGGRAILWCTYPSDNLIDVARHYKGRALVVYDCASGFSSHPKATSWIARNELELVSLADLFVTDNRKSYQDLGVHAKSRLYAPQGVADRFLDVTPVTSQNPRPVVGYVGTIHEWIDYDLLIATAEQLSDFAFVFIGPVSDESGAARLNALPNVTFRGPVAHDQLPATIATFDVGIVPYKRAAFTEHVFPTKLLEYLAVGIPVVSTAFNPHDLKDFEEFVTIAPAVGDFAEGIAKAVLGGATSESVSLRKELARQHTWAGRYQQIVDAIGRIA